MLYKLNSRTAIQEPSRKQSNALFFSTKNGMSQCTYFEIYNRQQFKNAVRFFVNQTLCSLYWKQKKFCKSEQREDDFYKLAMGQSKLSYVLTFWFISIEKVANKKGCASLPQSLLSELTYNKTTVIQLHFCQIWSRSLILSSYWSTSKMTGRGKMAAFVNRLILKRLSLMTGHEF